MYVFQTGRFPKTAGRLLQSTTIIPIREYVSAKYAQMIPEKFYRKRIVMGDVTQSERYNRVVENIDQLPSLPAVVTRLIEIVNSPDTSADDAAGLIEKDPALTSKMLRLANSAFYGIPRTISSVSSAVVILGFNTIKSLVLSASVMKIFGNDMQSENFDRKQFWRHSIVCALAARTIVRSFMNIRMMDPESAFCAGILHDIGKLVFDQYLHDDYHAACRYAAENNVSLLDAESQVLGITHAELGRMLADKWALPIELEASIVSHHAPDTAGKIIDLVTVVHVADIITHHLNVDLWEGETGPREWARSRTLLKMDDAIYRRIVETVENEIDKSNEFFSIVNSGD
ncbi:MAG: HDOD domain-containing protein [Chitinivibrionales bacterium]|nr:HDOD domain-containing protein [Chitinivibrionales bacterium]